MLQFTKIEKDTEAKVLGFNLPAPFWLFRDSENPEYWAAFRQVGHALWESHWGGSGSPFKAKSFCTQALNLFELWKPESTVFALVPLWHIKSLKMCRALKYLAKDFRWENGKLYLLVQRR